jgi:uncharacterized protein (DUF1501 family)
VETAIYLTMASPSFNARSFREPQRMMNKELEQIAASSFSERHPWHRWPASPPAPSFWASTPWPPWRRAAAPGYRALVCIFLQGGNDGHGTVIATDSASFSAFTQARSGAPGLAYPMSSLLPITLKTPQSGRTFALNPALTGVQNLFNAGRAAIVANTGTLIAPATKAQVKPTPCRCPPRSSRTSIRPRHGRPSPPTAAAPSMWAGAARWPTSSKHEHEFQLHVHLHLHRRHRAVSLRPNLVPAQRHLGRPHPHLRPGAAAFGQPAAANPLASILTADESNLFAKEYGVVVNRSTAGAGDARQRHASRRRGRHSQPAAVSRSQTNKLTDNPLATHCRPWRIISGSGGLGVARQIFYVQLGSFDTHDNQAIQHAQLLTQLGQALEYFDGLMVANGMGNQVTTFTASDFGRTLTCNSDGTDHGWGSHHFVVGGAVQGQDMYGQYPVIGVNQANDVGAGRLIPPPPSSSTPALWRAGSDSPTARSAAGLSQLRQLRLQPVLPTPFSLLPSLLECD